MPAGMWTQSIRLHAFKGKGDSDFFEKCQVLRAETDELRMSRLRLCDLTARTIERGPNLLGIQVVERM
jgi:arginyl-tRNA synthetase